MAKNPFVINEDTFQLLRKTLNTQPPLVPAVDVQETDPKKLEALRYLGLSAKTIHETIAKDMVVNYDRYSIYQEITRAIEHPFIAAAMSLYSDYSSPYSYLHNATIWITSESQKYEKELNGLLERIGMEEKAYDWLYNLGSFGDLFVKPEAAPGLGVVTIDDSMHPISVNRVDYKGTLIGFYLNEQPKQGSTDEQILRAPWDYVHMRLLGSKIRRPMSGDAAHSEMRSIHLLTDVGTFASTTKYGSSLLIDALPVYKRLRLAEDSLLMARATRGITRYIWKLAIDPSSSNSDAAAALIDQYASLITKARAVDTSSTSPTFSQKSNWLGNLDDIFVPIWGQSGDLTYDKIGGEVDIRWIVDIDDLRNQLAAALRTPMSLLGAYVQESSGQLGSEAISQLDVRFAKNSRRLQRALIEGIYRICQIHLAYMNMDPDPTMFQVHMGDTSTAEEEMIRNSLDEGADVIDKFIETASNAADDKIDKVELFNFLSQKILKLEGFDLKDYVTEKEGLALPELRKQIREAVQQHIKKMNTSFQSNICSHNTDLLSYLPIDENKSPGGRFVGRGHETWKSLYENAKIGEQKT